MRKRIFNILFISVFAAMLGLGIISPLMPIYAETLGATGIWLGLIFSGFAISRLIFSSIIGKISDVKGRKNFIIFGLLGYTIVSLLYVLADNVFSLIAIRFVHGFASAFTVPIAMAYVAETREEGTEGTSMGTFNMALFLGMGSGPFLGGILNDAFGMDSAFYFMTGLSLIAFLTVLFFLPNIKFMKKNEDQVPFAKIIKNNIIKGLLFFRATNAMGRAALMSFLPIFASRINIATSQIGLVVSVNILITALLQRSFGKLADRYNKFNLIVIGTVIGAFALLLIPFTNNFISLFLVSCLMGVGGGIAIPAATAVTVGMGKEFGMGKSMGLLNTAMSFGMVVAPLISGVIFDLININAVFYFGGLISFFSVLILFYYIRKEIKTN